MKYKAHFVGGILASGLTYSKVFETLNTQENSISGLFFVAGTLLGAVLPDIDEKNTYISNKVSIPYHILLKHRGLTHYPIITGILLFFLYIAVNMVPLIGFFLGLFVIGLFVGCMSHYVLDTPEGVNWLFPIVRRNIGKMTPSKYKKPLTVKLKHFAFDSCFFILSAYSIIRFLQN